jgi:acyl-CoA synthetase (AMP-forming)/AMP-acid ligase II/acyl carrier protein
MGERQEKDTFACFVDVLRRKTLEVPDKTAYTFVEASGKEQRSYSYAELDRRARAIAARLQECTTPGDRALLVYPPGPDFMEAFWGCLYAGVIAVPVYPPDPTRLQRSLPRLVGIVDDAAPSVILSNTMVAMLGKGLGAMVPQLGSLPWEVTDTIDAAKADSWDEPRLGDEDLAFLQYTSGSTSEPKGVMISHGNLLHNEDLIHRAFDLAPEDVGVGWLPLYHDMGLIGNALQTVFTGGRFFFLSPLDFLRHPISWLSTISRHRANISGGPNFAYELCVKRITAEQREQLDLSCWRLAFNGAEPVRSETMERFAEAFASCGFDRRAFYPCYGLAEATLLVSGPVTARGASVRSFCREGVQQGRLDPRSTTDGRTLVGCGSDSAFQSVAIVDPTSRRRCPDGQVGEIWVSGPSVARGYYGKPEQTEATFHATIPDEDDARFLRTGDLGAVVDGELYVTGRIKDLIIVGGKNHYPHDIELTAETSHPALRKGSAAVFLVEDEGPLALVIEVGRKFRPSGCDAIGTDPQEIVGAIRAAVSEEHGLRLHAVALVKAGTIAKTSSGKIQRFKCREGFGSGELDLWTEISRLPTESRPAAERDLTPAVVRQWMVHKLAELLEIDPASVDVHRPIREYGLDSIISLGVVGAIEEWLCRTVDDDLLHRYPTIDALAHHLGQPDEAAA